MIDKIYSLKNQVVEHIEHELQDGGIERMDKEELGELADIVKDFAKAEKDCMEARYYKAVTDAMGGPQGYSGYGAQSGYYQSNQMGRAYTQGGSGYPGTSQGGRSGWQNQYGSGYSMPYMGYDGMSGYAAIDSVKQAMQSASPEERERMMGELRSMTGGSM